MTRARAATSRAFTLVEMLITFSVIAVALVVIIPAFGRITESANYSSAINRVTSTLSLARALAMESSRETAVVFLFDIETERTTLLIVRRADDQGVIPPASRANPDIPASVFIPADASPVLLPPGMGVYGLAKFAPDANPASIDRMARWYPNEARRDTGNIAERFWIFPRNDARIYINSDEQLRDFAGDYASYPGSYAVSFFVRFSPDGSIVSASPNSATVPNDSFLELPDRPRDPSAFPGQPDFEPRDRPLRFDPHVIFDRAGSVDLNPEVRLRSVEFLAVVDMTRLAEGAGVRSPWLVRPHPGVLDSGDTPPNAVNPNDPKARFLDRELNTVDPDAPNSSQIRRISRWIDENAEVITLNRFTGAALRRAPR